MIIRVSKMNFIRYASRRLAKSPNSASWKQHIHPKLKSMLESQHCSLHISQISPTIHGSDLAHKNNRVGSFRLPRRKENKMDPLTMGLMFGGGALLGGIGGTTEGQTLKANCRTKRWKFNLRFGSYYGIQNVSRHV